MLFVIERCLLTAVFLIKFCFEKLKKTGFFMQNHEVIITLMQQNLSTFV